MNKHYVGTFKNSEKPTEEEAKALAVLKEKYATMRAQNRRIFKNRCSSKTCLQKIMLYKKLN